MNPQAQQAEIDRLTRRLKQLKRKVRTTAQKWGKRRLMREIDKPGWKQ